ncbi:MAG: biotin--[acetyl-CoA-carboxylase] ligase [Christensenellales bacterium]|jgi:BirA family biotin operon repressor/biotin-[acetyl-CoA-carboxylase] ligase
MRDEVVALLIGNMGRFISGQAMSEQLGISRTAVWKHISKLKQEGCDIVSVNNRGHMLKSMPDSLHPGFFRVVFDKPREMFYYKELDSTNTRAKQLAADGCPDGTLVVADRQTGGRGRLGRGFFSPTGGIWMSLVLRPHLAPGDAQKITLMAAVAVVQAISVFTSARPQIKWPNDILIGEKKLCGILTEMVADMDALNYVVVGIGLNANIEEEDMPETLRPHMTSLLIESGCPVSRLQLTSAIVTRLEDILNAYLEKGDFEQVRREYEKYSLQGSVRITGIGFEESGQIAGIDENGELLLELDNGEVRRFLNGEVSLRRMEQHV